jgi:hypothetical protein
LAGIGVDVTTTDTSLTVAIRHYPGQYWLPQSSGDHIAKDPSESWGFANHQITPPDSDIDPTVVAAR